MATREFAELRSQEMQAPQIGNRMEMERQFEGTASVASFFDVIFEDSGGPRCGCECEDEQNMMHFPSAIEPVRHHHLPSILYQRPPTIHHTIKFKWLSYRSFSASEPVKKADSDFPRGNQSGVASQRPTSERPANIRPASGHCTPLLQL